MPDTTPEAGHPPPALVPVGAAQNRGVNRSFPMFRAILALMLREMSTRYGRSPGGYVWAVLEPLGMLLMMSIVFSALVRVPPLGDNFMLFFATGFLPFQLYGSINNAVARSISFSRALLFYPTITWVDAVSARFILTLMTELLVFILLIFAIISIFHITLLLDIMPVIKGLTLAAVFGFGVGMFNCVLFGFFPVWMNVWAILNRPMFFISGILFLYEGMPANIQTYLWYNPLLHVIGLVRSGFYPTYDATYASPLYVMIWAILPIFMGVLLMHRFHREILNR